MKNLTIILTLLATVIPTSIFASIETEHVKRYNSSYENTIIISSQFAQAEIKPSAHLLDLSNVTIHHVDLVYTGFRASSQFNQQSLNEQRIDKLKTELPQIEDSDPTWRAICQTGAETVEEARQYFHGFILHISPAMNRQSLDQYFEEYQEPTTIYEINNAEPITLNYSSGTKISIPTNAVVDSEGNPVLGRYNLQYSEFRNQADIVFSGIPMNYAESGTTFNFSSVGMYEIRAFQNGDTLELVKPISIDFQTTDNKEGVGFFLMDDETGEWEKIKDIDFEPNKSDSVINKPNLEGYYIEWAYLHGEHKSDFTFSPDLFELLMIHLDTIPDWADRIMNVNKIDHSLTMANEFVDQFNDCVVNSYVNQPIVQAKNDLFELPQNNAAPLENDTRATLLAEGSTDPGHTYPKVVKGLNSNKFGVYNCDQIYRIGKSRNISPTYIDSETGKEIKNKHVTCIIDMTYNGSFSFQPNYLTCNLEGKNVILLFTTDKRTYMLDAEEFDKLDVKTNPSPVFAMVDMTDQIKSTKDLRQVLKL